MHKAELSPLRISPACDVARLRDRSVLAELRLGRRWHYRSVGRIRVWEPDEAGRVAVDLVMPTSYPGREPEIIPLTADELSRLVPADGRVADFEYQGVLYLHDDESEDTGPWTQSP